MYFFVYTPSNQHFKAFLVSKFNPETSFLYQLFKENSNFIVIESFKVICNSIFMIFIIIYIYSYLYLCIYTPSYPHFNPLNTSTRFLILDPFRVQTVELMSRPKNHEKCPQNRFL